MPRKFDPEESLRLIEKEKVTVVMGVPAIWQMLIAAPLFKTADLSSCDISTTAATRCPLEVVKVFRERGLTFGGGYGLTETSPTAFMLEPKILSEGRRRLGSSASPRSLTRRALSAPRARTCPPARSRDLVAWRERVGGYLNRPDANAAGFTEGWFPHRRPGDARRRRCTFVVGRSKEMFKSGGLNVYPAEIEAVMGRHPAIREVCVIGVPDPKWNEVGKAIVALKPGATATPNELIAFCEGQLARYKLPKKLVFVDALPRNTLGKVNRGELKQKFSARAQRAASSCLSPTP